MITGAHILIIDDNPQNLKVLGKTLSEEGYRISMAQSGGAALKAVDLVIPDLVLLDVMMPDMDGFETCLEFQKRPRMINVPIIFLTAKTETESIVKGFNLGAVDYILKPFNSYELLARVKTHLTLKFSQETVLQQKKELQETLHILCHDLANPLQCIWNYMQISDENPDILKKRKDLLKSSTRQGIEVITLVKQLQAISEGKMALSLAYLNLKEILENTLKVLEHQFVKKQIKPNLTVDNDLTILAEKTSLTNSVLANLLTNAIKFSYPNSEIAIKAQEVDNQVVLSIKDSGVGIPKDLLNTIFQANKATTRRGTEGEKGTGFGMPLVEKFVRAYGGDIKISSVDESDSPDNHGTEIEITFNTSKTENT